MAGILFVCLSHSIWVTTSSACCAVWCVRVHGVCVCVCAFVCVIDAFLNIVCVFY